ncbi:MAG: hypothetical protein ACJ790_10285 [Myxococcaceae bacterium]
MASDDREEMRRTEVVTRMEDAKRLIEPPVRQQVSFQLVRFADYVRDGQLEAAWDALAEAGEELDVPARFWRALAEAASLLRLEERRAEAAAHAARSE